jgi:hypothetical protein
MNSKELINWTNISKQLANNKSSIRSNKIPTKYKEDIEQLLYYIDAWLNCKQLTTKEEVINQVESKVKKEMNELIAELHNIAKSPFISVRGE